MAMIMRRLRTFPLDEILLLCLLEVLAGAESVGDIALFGCKKHELLRQFRPFKDGTPAHAISVTSWWCSTLSNSRIASSPGPLR